MRKSAFSVLLFLCFFSGQLLFASSDSNWSRWRGPDNNGISKEVNWNPAALNSLNKKWSVQLGFGYSSVSIQGRYVYTMGHKNGKDTIYCLDFNTGQTVWKHSYKATLGSYKGTRATPIFSEGRLYTLGRDGDVFCFNAMTGKVIWSKNIIRNYNARNIQWSFASSPYIYKNLVVFNANQKGLALDKNTGRLVWNSKRGDCSYATPVLFSRNSKDYIAMFSAKGLYILSPDTGKEHAFYRWKTKYEVNAADPVITDRGIFISSSYGTGCALLEFTGSKLKEVWRNKNMKNHFSSTILIDDFLYGVSGKIGRAKLTCIDLANGRTQWESKKGYEAVTAAGKNFLSITKKGELIISKITPDSHEVIAKQKIINDRKAAYWTAPVLCRGSVVSR